MIELTNIHFGYSKKRKLFNDLNLQLSSGHLYGLLGKNGAGKTTLLKLICGLRFPHQGTSLVAGHHSIHRSPLMLRQLYFLMEEFYTPHLWIRDYAKIYAPFYPNFNREQFYAYLEEFDIFHLNEYIDKLSYGQKKKVMISFALASNTPILLMDEPTNGLDIPSKTIFRKIMASVLHEEQIVIISTHQVRDLHSIIDSVVIIDDGQILLNQSTDEITQKLFFEINDEVLEEDSVLYHEESLHGFNTVRKNLQQIESKIDMELLFNATMAHTAQIKEIFNSNKTMNYETNYEKKE